MQDIGQVVIKNHISYFPCNQDGRDFVVGDIHGEFDMVKNALHIVEFDPIKDRLFCTGDLIDRGEDSVDVLEFLDQPFVYSVIGDHDFHFASKKIKDLRDISQQLDGIGLYWVNRISDQEILKIQNRFKQLPYVIEIQTRFGLIGIVHADVPKGMTWLDFKEGIQSMDAETSITCLEGRDRSSSGDCSGVSGIFRLFAGHTVHWDGPRRLGNVFLIDTGAVHRRQNNKGSLTILNILCDANDMTVATLKQ